MINEVSPEILQKLREIANNPGKCYDNGDLNIDSYEYRLEIYNVS